jgi:RNA polymerase sigma factor (sigma-70 family)
LLNTIALTDDHADITQWAAFKKGDRQAFSALFRQYYPLLVQYGSKICIDPLALEDCIQDLFIELWQSRASAEVKSVKAYLLKSLKYKLYKLFRQQNPMQSADAAFDTMAFEISHENFMVEREEERSKTHTIINAVNQLPDRQKEIVYLKIFKELGYEEISEVMNINYQVARNLFSQAMKSLRQLLK